MTFDAPLACLGNPVPTGIKISAPQALAIRRRYGSTPSARIRPELQAVPRRERSSHALERRRRCPRRAPTHGSSNRWAVGPERRSGRRERRWPFPAADQSAPRARRNTPSTRPQPHRQRPSFASVISRAGSIAGRTVPAFTIAPGHADSRRSAPVCAFSIALKAAKVSFPRGT